MDRSTFAPTEPLARGAEAQPTSSRARSLEGSNHLSPTHVTPGPSDQDPGPWVGEGRPELGIRPYIRLWRQYRALILTVFSLCLIGSALRIVFYPRTYMAKSTILPSGGQSGSGVMSLLASMTGIPPMMGGSVENSSNLFPRILESRAVSLEVLNSRYKFVRDGVRIEGTLIDYLQARNVDEALRVLGFLRAIDVDKETGIIAISVRTPDPELSAAIANRCVEALERFNNEARRQAASQNTGFVQEQMEKARADLSIAEDRLARFKEQNMRMSSPELDLELLRLTRDVTLKSQVFVTLSSQAEVARVEEAKNLPIVRVLDRAVSPALPVPAPRIAMLAGGMLMGGVLAGMLVAALKLLEHIRREARLA